MNPGFAHSISVFTVEVGGRVFYYFDDFTNDRGQ